VLKKSLSDNKENEIQTGIVNSTQLKENDRSNIQSDLQALSLSAKPKGKKKSPPKRRSRRSKKR